MSGELDKLEDLLGVPITERLIEATHEVLKEYSDSEISAMHVVIKVMKSVKEVAKKFELDELKFEHHIRWFHALYKHHAAAAQPYDKDTKHDFINGYSKKYPRAKI